MRRYLEEDREKTSVAAEGDNRRRALKSAASSWTVPSRPWNTKSWKGGCADPGLGKKPWKIAPTSLR
jgi:hypothetical protein